MCSRAVVRKLPGVPEFTISINPLRGGARLVTSTPEAVSGGARRRIEPSGQPGREGASGVVPARDGGWEFHGESLRGQVPDLEPEKDRTKSLAPAPANPYLGRWRICPSRAGAKFQWP